MKRYLAANRPDGTSDVLLDEEITDLPEKAPGVFARDLWLSYQTPADNSNPADPVSGFQHEPPDGGAIFRIMKLAPGHENDLTPETAAAMHNLVKSVHVPDDDALREAKHPSMHKTDTLNYMVVVAGQMTMLTEGRDVVMYPGDVVIQQGCMHGWRNDGTEPAVLIATMIDSLPSG